MPKEHIFLSPRDLESLEEKDILSPPDWFHKISSTLTYSPFVVKKPWIINLYMGNSGLTISQLASESHFGTAFSPNGNVSRERGEEENETRNIGIWTIAFKKFLDYYQENKRGLFFSQLNIIEGETNDEMLSIRLRLLNSLSPRAMTVEETYAGSTFQINIRQCLLGFQGPTFDSSLFNRVRKRFNSLEGQLEIINPRLQKYNLDPQTGKYSYEVAG